MILRQVSRLNGGEHIRFDDDWWTIEEFEQSPSGMNVVAHMQSTSDPSKVQVLNLKDTDMVEIRP